MPAPSKRWQVWAPPCNTSSALKRTEPQASGRSDGWVLPFPRAESSRALGTLDFLMLGRAVASVATTNGSFALASASFAGSSAFTSGLPGDAAFLFLPLLSFFFFLLLLAFIVAPPSSKHGRSPTGSLPAVADPKSNTSKAYATTWPAKHTGDRHGSRRTPTSSTNTRRSQTNSPTASPAGRLSDRPTCGPCCRPRNQAHHRRRPQNPEARCRGLRPCPPHPRTRRRSERPGRPRSDRMEKRRRHPPPHPPASTGTDAETSRMTRGCEQLRRSPTVSADQPIVSHPCTKSAHKVPHDQKSVDAVTPASADD